jgi:hypothetical protein
MPEAMMNGGFAPYLAQAFTPQGVPGGMLGGMTGNVPGNVFYNPAIGQPYGQIGMAGGISPFTAMPQLPQPFPQFQAGWQQPLQQLGQTFGGFQQQSPQLTQPFGGWQQLPLQQLTQPFGTWQQQLGQPFGQSIGNWQEPVILAHLLRRYAVPISVALASPYGQAHIAQNIVQTAEILARVLPLVGAPQLTPLAQLLGQYAQPISAAIALSPHGQAHIAQNIFGAAEIVERIVPLIGTTHQLQTMTQPYAGWQQVPQQGVANVLGQMSGPIGWPLGQQQFGQYLTQPSPGWQQQVPQFPVANLLGQINQPQLAQQVPLALFGVAPGQYGQGQPGLFSGHSGDTLNRMLPFLAQQSLGGQGYGMARV